MTRPATNNKPVQHAISSNRPTQKPVTDNSDWAKWNGILTTGGAINLRTSANTNSKAIALLPANTEIKYGACRTTGQYTWLRQLRANGQHGYLVGRSSDNVWDTFKAGSAKATTPVVHRNTQKIAATINNSVIWTKQSGTLITGGATNLRTGAGTKSPIIETLPINTVIKYDVCYRVGRYIWLGQLHVNDQYGYLVGRLNNQTWGTCR